MSRVLPILLILALLVPAGAAMAWAGSSCAACCCARTVERCPEAGTEGIGSSRCGCGVSEQQPATAPAADVTTTPAAPETAATPAGASPATRVARGVFPESLDTTIGSAGGGTEPLYVLVCSFIS